MRFAIKMPDITAALTPEEFDALKEIGKGFFRRIIPDRHRKRLVELGLAKEGAGGIELTEAGIKRVAANK
jgi:hypothetical protein